MTRMRRLLFGLGMGSLVFAAALAIDYALLRISVWQPVAFVASPQVAAAGGQAAANQPD